MPLNCNLYDLLPTKGKKRGRAMEKYICAKHRRVQSRDAKKVPCSVRESKHNYLCASVSGTGLDFTNSRDIIRCFIGLKIVGTLLSYIRIINREKKEEERNDSMFGLVIIWISKVNKKFNTI